MMELGEKSTREWRDELDAREEKTASEMTDARALANLTERTVRAVEATDDLRAHGDKRSRMALLNRSGKMSRVLKAERDYADAVNDGELPEAFEQEWELALDAVK